MAPGRSSSTALSGRSLAFPDCVPGQSCSYHRLGSWRGFGLAEQGSGRLALFALFELFKGIKLVSPIPNSHHSSIFINFQNNCVEQSQPRIPALPHSPKCKVLLDAAHWFSTPTGFSNAKRLPSSLPSGCRVLRKSRVHPHLASGISDHSQGRNSHVRCQVDQIFRPWLLFGWMKQPFLVFIPGPWSLFWSTGVQYWGPASDYRKLLNPTLKYGPQILGSKASLGEIRR